MLDGVVRGKKQPARVVVYGPPKIGKSTLGSQAPAPVFVTTEDGVDNLPVDQFTSADSWAAFLANVKAVAEGNHEYKTLVVDTLNGAVDLAAALVCAEQFEGNWTKFHAYGGNQGWASVSEKFRELLPLLDVCRARGLTVLLLSHTGMQKVKHPVKGEYDKLAPAIEKRIWTRLASWADVILHADYDYAVLQEDPKKRGRAVGTTTRVLTAAGSAAEDAGCRVGYELPDTLELSWQALEDALGQDSQTLADVTARWHLLSDAEQKKTLAWLGVKDLAEAAVSKLRPLLNKLKKREVDNAA